jgi:putative protein-disulfide isomerase
MARLHYVHDPMCSWCWAFSPVLRMLESALPAGVVMHRLLGGLAPDTDEPMPEAMRRYLRTTWRKVQERVPGTRFDFRFWEVCNPRRATYPACRAVIAARAQGEAFDRAMTTAIQHAYYLQARNPSEDATLVALAGELGLDVAAFERALNAPATQARLHEEIAQARAMGVDSFPSLVLETPSGCRRVAVDYLDAGPMLEVLSAVLEQD